MRLITLDDFIDLYVTAKKRGWSFIRSKLNPSAAARTKSAFDTTVLSEAHWFMIPYIKRRWNTLITGDETTNYKQWLMQDYFGETKDLKMLSLGSGDCSHEIELAGYPQFKKITCVDLAANRIATGKANAETQGLTNMQFVCADILDFDYDEDYDIVLFNMSLHHFNRMDHFLGTTIYKVLKPNGHLIINEYVGKNRQQFDREQRNAINAALATIPKKYRKRIKTNMYKNAFHGAGWLRMYLADPSECVEAERIIPSLDSYYERIAFKPYGGNILTHVP